jgi:hypothetical protein
MTTVVMVWRYGSGVDGNARTRCKMLHIHELSNAVQADREREIRDRLPRQRGLASGSRHPQLPDSGVVVAGVRRIELKRDPSPAFGG